MNELERRWRCWVPRSPSPDVKAKLFGKSEPHAPPGFRSSPGMHWLAPATAAVLGVLLLVNYRESISITPASPTRELAVAVLSNRTAAASLSATSIQAHNTLAADTFEWTNDNGSFSSVSSLFPRKGTNH